MLKAVVLAALPLVLAACAGGVGQQQQQASYQPRLCPLGNTTEISATGPMPQKMALNMAASATLRDGYEKFTIVSGGPTKNGTSYSMLIRMAHLAEETDPSRTVMADNIVVAAR